MRFQVICSDRAAAELPEEECREVIQRVIPLALERDGGVHEGLVFSFDMHGKQWQIVVDLAERWVKILGKDDWTRGSRMRSGRTETLAFSHQTNRAAGPSRRKVSLTI